MARYTVTNLRRLVCEANEKYPRETPNYHGTMDRFMVDCAYGGYKVQEYYEDTSAVTSITSGYMSARECAEEFSRYLLKNY